MPALLLMGVIGFTASPQAQAPAAPAAPAAATQKPAPPAPQALTYEMAVQVIDAAEAEARKNNWNVTIVVTDAVGTPVVLRRITGASARSYDIAMRKAATVVAAKMTTAEYGAKMKEKAVTEVPNGITFAGGVPIMRGEEFLGAVGTSGVTAAQDEIISRAGTAVIK
ncbi:MAG: heme-binding protein [Acidobacteriota bacterium]|nr:heme-binding protein [Acidobacteriota bacterium]